MRRTLKFLVAAAAVALPSAAHAQACTAAQLAANPLVGLGYRALARINNTAFDLSCYYQSVGSNQVALTSTSVQFGVGPSAVTGTINQALFTTTPGSLVQFNYSLHSVIPPTGPTAADFVYAFAAPLWPNVYTDANAQLTVVRTSGSPAVRLIPVSSSASPVLPGQPAYLVANHTAISSTSGGTAANPFASNLIWIGSTSCTAANGTTCNYAPVQTTPNASLSAWGNLVSYRHDKRNSSVTVSGQVSLATVPEPATVTLMATGLLALVGMGYSRRRSA